MKKTIIDDNREEVDQLMTDQPKVSVVIIFLDAEKYIRDAIDSICLQTYDNWELLLVDDGSRDKSTSYARLYVEQFPDKIRYLEHEDHQNRGMSASRNLGIQNATGEYIAFLDADDVWFPNTMQEQVEILKIQPEASMVYGPLLWWYSWSGNPEDSKRDYIERLGVPAENLIRPPQLLPLFLRDKAAVPSGFMVRKEVMEQLEGFEETFRGEYEDQVFCAKICLNTAIFVSNHCWYRYRQHPDSSVAIGQVSRQTYNARYRFLTWLSDYIKEKKVTNLKVRWAIWQELIPYNHKFLDRVVKRCQYYIDRSKFWLRGGGKLLKV